VNLLVCTDKDCQKNGSEETYKELMNYVEDVHFMHASCIGLCEEGPIVLVLPETTFYRGITDDLVDALIKGELEDQIIPTEDLYHPDMERYRSDPMHRRTVKLFRYQLEKMKAHDWRSIREILPIFKDKYDVSEDSLPGAVKIALLGTTKGPDLPKLIDMLGIDETYNRIDQYLQDNKYRI
jgi:(2Fe-2S) ferredoxin